jgi:hypothetical protein
MREYDRDTLIERLANVTRNDMIEMLADMIDATHAGAPYYGDGWSEAASCCSCCADSPTELMPYVDKDDDEEDVSLIVWIDDPQNHDDNCCYRTCREILRDLGFYYEPSQVRLAVPRVDKE